MIVFLSTIRYNRNMFLHKHDISLHPYLAVGIDLALSVLFLLSFRMVSSWVMLGFVIFLRLFLALVLTELVYVPAQISRMQHFGAVALFIFGNATMLLFVDWVIAWYAIAIALSYGSAAAYALIPKKNTDLSFLFKPHRRWLFLISAYALAALWSGLFAVIQFQVWYVVVFWIWISIGALITTAVSAWWWLMYGLPFNARFFYALGTVAAVVFELAMVISMLPWGFAMAGLMVTWMWYCLWHMLRFHLSPDGIDGRRQAWFLLLNAVAIILIAALVARWR